MSLRVDDGRSRGRSKSPGRKDERSRSRDVRAPSPAVVTRTKKTSKKYYSDESDSDTHSKKKSSKKRYENSSESDSEPKLKKKSYKKHSESDDSDSDPRSKRRSSRKHHDESDSDIKSKKKSNKRYSDSESDSKSRKKASKKHYESDSSSSSSEDDRKNKHKHSKKVASSRNGEYIETSTSRYERERHGSYASPERHERPVEFKRHMSTSSVESGEKRRQLSMPGAFKGGHSPHPQYMLPRPLA